MASRSPAHLRPCTRNRAAILLCQRHNSRLCSALPNTVPNIKQRTLGIGQRANNGFDILICRITRPHRLNLPLNNLCTHHIISEQPIVNSEVNRTDRRCFGNAQRALNRLRQAIRFNHRPARLGKRLRNRSWPHIVRQIQTHPVSITPRIPRKRKHHNGQASTPNIDQLPQTLRQPGTQMDDHHSRIEIPLCISPCHRGHTALVKCQNTVNIGIYVERVKKERLPRARVVKHILHAQRGELLDNNLGWCCGNRSLFHTP